MLVRRLAAAVRLDPVPDVAFPVLRAAGLEGPALRHVPVGRLAVDDPVRADQAGVPDVDDAVPALDVQPDPEAGEEDRGRGERPHGPGGPEGYATTPEARPRATCQQVRERRIHERHAAEDLSAIEEGERDREREEHEQVQVPSRERLPEVAESDEEEEAEREPDIGLEERLAAERAGPPTGHLPGDLRSGPGLGHAPGQVLDADERDLARFPRPRLHGPDPGHGVERGLGLRMRRVAP